MGAPPRAFAGMNWTSVDSMFVRVRTDEGVAGWGEGWGHVACPATAAALSTLVGPAFIGRDVSDRGALMLEMQHRLHVHAGRAHTRSPPCLPQRDGTSVEYFGSSLR